MKSFIITLFMFSLLSQVAFAAETTADCPMMRESTLRDNPKLKLESKKPTQGQSVSSVKAQ